jgi:hypothetical protein
VYSACCSQEHYGSLSADAVQKIQIEGEHGKLAHCAPAISHVRTMHVIT